jgi:hypothetical protein
VRGPSEYGRRFLLVSPVRTTRYALAHTCSRGRGCCLAGKCGRALTAVVDGCLDPPLARQFLSVFRVTSAKVKTSIESMRSLQSRCAAANYALGPFSALVNVSPSELHSHYVMALAGRPYGRDDGGWPDDARPASDERYRLVAGNPWACATFFHMFTAAWCEVFYGWPLGAHRQHNPGCLFGQVRQSRAPAVFPHSRRPRAPTVLRRRGRGLTYRFACAPGACR